MKYRVLVCWVPVLWVACGSDTAPTMDAGTDVLVMDGAVDAGPGDATLDAANTPTLQMRADAVINAYESWVNAGWYDTIVVGMREGDTESYAAIGTLEDGSPVSKTTPYEIGSITKTFTGLLLADAIQRGEVTLDTTLAELNPKRTFPEGPAGGEILLRHLTTHTSGLPTFPDDVPPGELDVFATYDADRLFDWVGAFTLPREPGQAFEYSNMAVGMLGYSLARAADTTFEELLQTRVLEPMGLEMTLEYADSMPPPRNAALEAVSRIQLMDIFSGAGEMRSSAEQLLEYARWQLHPEELEGTLAKAIPASHELLHSEVGGPDVGYNWFLNGGGELLVHSGGTEGFSAFLAILPSEDRALVVLANISGHIELGALYNQALDSLREQEVVPREPPIDYVISDLTVLDEYTGTYDVDGTDLSIVRKSDRLDAQFEGLTYNLFARAEDVFYLRSAPAAFTFLRADDGTVRAVSVFLDGNIEAPKID